MNAIKDVYQVQECDRALYERLMSDGRFRQGSPLNTIAQFRGDAELRAIGRERSRRNRAGLSARGPYSKEPLHE